MLRPFRKKAAPLREAVEEVIRTTDRSSIPSYIDAGLKYLFDDADSIKKQYPQAIARWELETNDDQYKEEQKESKRKRKEEREQRL